MFRAKSKKVALFIAAVSKDHAQKTEGEEEGASVWNRSQLFINEKPEANSQKMLDLSYIRSMQLKIGTYGWYLSVAIKRASSAAWSRWALEEKVMQTW